MKNYPDLKDGLDQIPKEGLTRLKKALEDKSSSLTFDGDIARKGKY